MFEIHQEYQSQNGEGKINQKGKNAAFFCFFREYKMYLVAQTETKQSCPQVQH